MSPCLDRSGQTFTGTNTFNAGTTFSGTVLAKNTSNSTTAFQVQNSAGNNFLAVDTQNTKVSIGDSGIASTIQVGNTTGGVAQTINIGTNATASATSAINIGTGSGTVNTLVFGNSTSGTSTTINGGNNSQSSMPMA
jgi:hypothetical protein